jgi:hypothetical protein
MSDPTPASPEKTVTMDRSQLCRLRTLTYLSLAFNTLILLFIVCAIFHHHKQQQQGFAGQGGWGGNRFQGQCSMGFGHRFHHFGGNFGPGQGWGNRGGFGGGRFGGNGPGNNGFNGGPGMMNRGPGGNGPGMGGGFGMGGPGMMMRGGPGMMAGGPPDPAKMTDNILAMLTQKLTLTDDQKAKLKPIIQDQVTQFQKQMEAQRAAMQKQIEDAKAQIKPILNADQQKQLDALPLPGQKPAPAADDQSK